MKGLTGLAASKAQLGLGHSYSRAKVKFNVNRADNMIIQSIALLDQLDKDINTFSMRVRWATLQHTTETESQPSYGPNVLFIGTKLYTLTVPAAFDVDLIADRTQWQRRRMSHMRC